MCNLIHDPFSKMTFDTSTYKVELPQHTIAAICKLIGEIEATPGMRRRKVVSDLIAEIRNNLERYADE
jgi:hypothetical protein